MSSLSFAVSVAQTRTSFPLTRVPKPSCDCVHRLCDVRSYLEGHVWYLVHVGVYLLAVAGLLCQCASDYGFWDYAARKDASAWFPLTVAITFIALCCVFGLNRLYFVMKVRALAR